MKKIFSFALILADETVATEELAEQIYGSGIHDASVFSSEGVVEILFDREGENAASAITSAVLEVRKAGFRVRDVVDDDGHSFKAVLGDELSSKDL